MFNELDIREKRELCLFVWQRSKHIDGDPFSASREHVIKSRCVCILLKSFEIHLETTGAHSHIFILLYEFAKHYTNAAVNTCCELLNARTLFFQFKIAARPWNSNHSGWQKVPRRLPNFSTQVVISTLVQLSNNEQSLWACERFFVGYLARKRANDDKTWRDMFWMALFSKTIFMRTIPEMLAARRRRTLHSDQHHTHVCSQTHSCTRRFCIA